MALRGLSPRRHPALWAAGLFFLVHLPLLGLAELSGDESFYWLYAKHLDWGYLTNPPLIGWVVAASTGLFGQSATAVRLGVLAVAALGVFALVHMGRSMGDGRTGWYALAFFFLAPLSWLYGFMAAPDVLLAALVTCSLAAALAAWRSGRRILWSASGALLGLALLAKYSAVLPALGLLPLVLAGARRWGWKAPAAWAGAGLAVASPHLLWLAGNGAEPLRLRVAVHAREGVGGLFAGRSLVHFLLTQSAVWSPVAVAIVLWSLWRLLRDSSWRGRPELVALGAATAIPFGAFLLWSRFGPVHPYWTSVALPPASGLAALSLGALSSGRRRLVFGALAVQAALLLAAGALVLGGHAGLGARYLERRARWTPGENRRLAAQVRPLLDAAGPGALLATSHGYATVSQLAFELGVPRRAVVLAPEGLAVQLEDWAEGDWKGRNAVVVAPGLLDGFPLAVYFESCGGPERIALTGGRVYTVAVCQGYRGPARWLWEPASLVETRDVAAVVYRALLERPPDPEGLRSVSWALDRGELANLVWNVTRSPEYRGRFSGEAPEATARRILRGLGEQDPDPGELRRAVGLLSWGGPYGLFLRLLAERGGLSGIAGRPPVSLDPPA